MKKKKKRGEEGKERNAPRCGGGGGDFTVDKRENVARGRDIWENRV